MKGFVPKLKNLSKKEISSKGEKKSFIEIGVKSKIEKYPDCSCLEICESCKGGEK